MPGTDHPPRSRRLGRRISLGLVAVGLLALGADRGREAWRQRTVVGPLTVDASTPASGQWSLGAFTLRWSREAARLSIHPTGDPERWLWSSVAGEAFVAAADGEETVRESRGLFDLEDRLSLVCRRQRLTALHHDGASFEVQGSLGCDGGGSSGGGDAAPYTLRFTERSPGRLEIDLAVGTAVEDSTRHTPIAARLDRVLLTGAAEPGEGFYGFGAQFSHFDLVGRRLPILVSEQGIGRGAQPVTLGADLTAGAGGRWHHSYAPVPHYLTSALRSFALTSSEASIFDLRKRRVQVRLLSNHLRGSIYRGRSPADLIAEHSRRAGRMRPLPDWVHRGAIIGLQGGTDRVRQQVARLEAHGVPISALWLQDWVGQRTTTFGKQLWWSWQLDEGHYPGWHDWLEELAERDIRVLTYVNPFLTDISERPDADQRRDLFGEARRRGFLVRDAEGEPLLLRNTSFSAGLLDLTHPGARRWIAKILRDEVLGAGASGWMADFGEALPWDAQLHDGQPASTLHNRYPELWARINRQVVEDSDQADDLLFFSRAGFTNSPRHTTLFWLGDQMVSWDEHDGIKTAVTGLLSSGLSGFSLNHSDIGGYTTLSHPLLDVHRDAELLMRWTELNAFTAVFRTHEGNQPEANVQVTHESTLEHFARLAKVYRAWAPYRRVLVQQAAEVGLPVVRHPWIHYPDDSEVRRIRNEVFLVGEDLLVAPVLDPGRDAVRAYLPSGVWRHLWSGTVHDTRDAGRWLEVAAPLGEPAVFLRQGSEIAGQLPDALRADGFDIPTETSP